VFPIPVHSGLSIGRTSLAIATAQEDELFNSLPRYDWHPSSLTWDIISEIREKCTKEIAMYQGSLLDIDSPSIQISDRIVETNFTRLSKVAAKVIAESRCKIPAPPPWQEPIAIGTYAISASLAAVYGLTPKYLATASVGVAAAAYTLIRKAFLARDTHAIGESLKQFGLQYNLHRMPKC
jgi:hypothetical protein